MTRSWCARAAWLAVVLAAASGCGSDGDAASGSPTSSGSSAGGSGPGAGGSTSSGGGTGAEGGATSSASTGGAGAGPVATVDPCIEAGTCPPGVWIQSELPGFTSPDTVQTVLADPARPSDFYAFVGSNNGPTIKVYRSTDYGGTWENVNQTAEITGNPWGASIDPNPYRDPSTSPTMWSPSGYGAAGAWKSTDGGQTWVRSPGCDAAFGPYNPFGATLTDLYHVEILPDDPPNHVLATYHYGFKDNGDGGFGETWDGGQSWVVHPPPAGVGTSHYVIPVSATTWVVISQDNNGLSGMWRTTTAGRTGGTEQEKFRDGTISTAAWTKVDALEHAHGSHQNVVAKDGTLFATGWVTGARSTDDGATWSHFTEGSWAEPHQFEQSLMTNLAITDKYIYTTFMSGTPMLTRVAIDDPIGAEKWDLAYCETPAAMHEGGAPFGMASSKSATAWILVSGTYGSGIWKYVEP